MKRILGQTLLMGVLSFAVALNMATTVLAAEQTIFARALTDHECEDTDWLFVITGIEEEIAAPDHIHVMWANGEDEHVSLQKVTGKEAHYVTTSNLEWEVMEAHTMIADEWEGVFKLRHGPCDVVGPGKGTDLGAFGAAGHHTGHHHDHHSEHQILHSDNDGAAVSAQMLPKTGDADLAIAGTAAGLFGLMTLATGVAGRMAIRGRA